MTPLLVGACVLVFVALETCSRLNPALAGRIEAAAVLIPHVSPWWTYLTYAFLHGGFMHLLGNMLILWVFGPPVEDRLGRWWFLAFYLAGAVAAGALHSFFEPSGVVGASGAIAAVTGAFLVMFPFTRVRCWFILFMSITIVPAWWFIGLAMVWDLVLQGMGHGGSVARLAHLGGYTLGATVSCVLLATGLLPREPYDVFSMAKRANRRRQFRAQVATAERELSANRQTAAADAARLERIAAARATLTQALAAKDSAALANEYRALLDLASDTSPGLCTLPPRQQLELATLLHAGGHHAMTAQACAWFVAAYPRDPQSLDVRVLGAITYQRYLGNSHSARAMLEGAAHAPADSETAGLISALRGEIDAAERAQGSAASTGVPATPQMSPPR